MPETNATVAKNMAVNALVPPRVLENRQAVVYNPVAPVLPAQKCVNLFDNEVGVERNMLLLRQYTQSHTGELLSSVE